MFPKQLLFVASVSLSFATPVAGQTAPTPTQQDSIKALHLLARATFGPTPTNFTEILTIGRAEWLDRQLQPESIADAGLSARLAFYPVANAGMDELFRLEQQRQQQQRLARQAAANRDSTNQQDAPRRPLQDMTPDQREMLAVVNPGRMLADLTAVKLVRSVYTERQLEEVMTDFWYNHFNVFYGKGIDRLMVYDYQETAIRPNVFGKFEDMLVATARHPAMLFYLDNWSSSVPDSLNPQAMRARRDVEERLRQIRALTPQQRQRMIMNGRLTLQQIQRLEEAERQLRTGDQQSQRGINENYARELMELHTLGVDGGYTQDDVVQVARVFTGWTFRRPNARQAAGRVGGRGRGMGGMMAPAPDEPVFEFRAQQHYPGDKVVLGTVIPESGMAEGEEVLHLLATHPSTARHIATELVEWFVTDEPAPAAVDELTQVFLSTDGDLRAVTRALFEADWFFDESYRGTQVKTPFQLVVSTLRMSEAEVGRSRALLETLRAMGHVPYNEVTPTGYPATQEDWINSAAMLSRMNFSLTLVSGGIDGVALDPANLADAGDVVLPMIRGRAGGAGRRGAAAAGMDPGARMRARAGRAAAQAARAASMEPVTEEWLDAWVNGLTDRLLPGTDASALRRNVVADLIERQEAGDPTPVLAVRGLGLVLGSPDFQKR